MNDSFANEGIENFGTAKELYSIMNKSGGMLKQNNSKASEILAELKENGKLHAIKELKPNVYSVDQAAILDVKEFDKQTTVKLFQLSIALNKGYVKL